MDVWVAEQEEILEQEENLVEDSVPDQMESDLQRIQAYSFYTPNSWCV